MREDNVLVKQVQISVFKQYSAVKILCLREVLKSSISWLVLIDLFSLFNYLDVNEFFGINFSLLHPRTSFFSRHIGIASVFVKQFINVQEKNKNQP